MRCNISIENGARDFTKISAQVLVVTTVGHTNAGGHVNEQLVYDQSVGAKRDKFMHRQTTVVAQFTRFRDAG